MPRPRAPILLFLLLLLLAPVAAAECVGPDPIDGSVIPIAKAGPESGDEGQTVDWYIFNNTYWQGWANYSGGDILVEAGWVPEGSGGPTCSSPYLSSAQTVKYYSWTVNPAAWNTYYGEFPAIQVQVQLPSTTDPLTFYWVVHIDGNHYIYYKGNLQNNDKWDGLLDIIVNALKAFIDWLANQVLSLLPDWLRSIIETSWQLITGFAPAVFSLLSKIFQVYPFIFMMISLRYILAGDMEGWLNYVLWHVKIIKVFIDLGFKLIELIKP